MRCLVTAFLKEGGEINCGRECDGVGTTAVTGTAIVREYQLAQMTLNVTTNNPRDDDQTRARVIQKGLELLRAKVFARIWNIAWATSLANTQWMKDAGTNLGRVLLRVFWRQRKSTSLSGTSVRRTSLHVAVNNGSTSLGQFEIRSEIQSHSAKMKLPPNT